HVHLSRLRWPLSTLYLPISFLLIRPPPNSPPFPYTTLFRSHGRPSRPCVRHPCGRHRRRHNPPARKARRSSRQAHGSWSACRATDRKSTRLNSSHVKISYAVFCLKKKKKVYQLLCVNVLSKC